MRELVTDAAGAGLTTVGDLLDHLGRLAPAERRALLDRARSGAGLPTATEVAAKASHAEQDRLLSVAAADDVPLQLVPSANGWRDPDAEARGAAQARAEAERRAAQRARSLAARAAELPALEREEAAEREAWIGANLMRPERTR